MATGSDLNVKLSESPICGICEENDNIKRQGVKYCCNCCQWICSECVSNHKKYSAMKHHTLQDKPGSPSVPVAVCTAHPAQLIMYYCSLCSVAICPLCRLDNGGHEGHGCISLEQQVNKVRSVIEETLSALMTNKKTVERQQQALDSAYSSAADYLDNLERDLRKAINEQRKKIQETKSNVKKPLGNELNNITEDLKMALNYKDDANAAIAVTDLSRLSSVSDPKLPEIPKFPRGLYEAGLQVLLGGSVTRQHVTDILKRFRSQGNMSTGLYEAGVRILLNERLTKQDVTEVLKLFGSKGNLPIDMFEAWLALCDKLTDKQKNQLLDAVVTQEQLAGLMTVGVRVKPGRDWSPLHGSRDMTGTVTSGLDANKRVGVRWDDGHSVSGYFMGCNNQYQLTLLF